jgi:hypothetical protein
MRGACQPQAPAWCNFCGGTQDKPEQRSCVIGNACCLRCLKIRRPCYFADCATVNTVSTQRYWRESQCVPQGHVSGHCRALHMSKQTNNQTGNRSSPTSTVRASVNGPVHHTAGWAQYPEPVHDHGHLAERWLLLTAAGRART